MKRYRKNGQALILVAFGLLVLTGVVGLGIDMGYLRYLKRRLQTAADSAAIAGASELKTGDYRAAALSDSKSNGFEDGVNGVTVSPSHPPADAGAFKTGDLSNYVEVQVQQQAPTFFMRVLGVNSATISATAVAYLGNSKGCVYALGPLGGINVNATVNAPNCGVIDNAVLSVGGGCINAASIGVVLNLLGGCATPPPVVGIATTPDPLAYLIAPGIGACVKNPSPINNPAGTVLTPGTYCGGINVAAGNTGPVTFLPGLYVLNGGGVSVQGNSNLTGNGVTFYVTIGGSVQLNGTGNVTLTASTDAPAAGIPGGILFFQDRGNNQGANLQAGNLLLTGALYFPSAPLTLGGGGATDYVIVVADTINFNGNIDIGANYSTITGGSPVKAAVLVQ
jgi:Putative Flp pilus-assembly TadE/G-like